MVCMQLPELHAGQQDPMGEGESSEPQNPSLRILLLHCEMCTFQNLASCLRAMILHNSDH